METQTLRKASELKPWLKYLDVELPDVKETETTAFQYVFNRNKDNLEGVAINYFDCETTYASLFSNIRKTASALKKIGVKNGDIVTVCSAMLPEVIYLFYALDLIGATPNMIDPRTSPKGMHEYIEEVDSKLVVTIDAAYKTIKEAIKDTAVEKVLVVSPKDSLKGIKKTLFSLTNRDKTQYSSNVVLWKDFLNKGSDEELYREYDEKHATVIVHTGGTTGKSKGVMLGDKSFNALAVQGIVHHFRIGSRYLNIMPPFIAYGFAVGVHLPLVFGMQVVVIPKFDPTDFAKLLLKYKPNAMAGVPAHYQILMKDKRMEGVDLSFVDAMGAGGDGINIGAEEEVNNFLKAHNAKYKLGKGYGMTECTSMVASNVREHNKLGSVGFPLCLSNMAIFEPGTDNELGFNEYGEICVSGPNLMLGYYNNEEETANVLRTHSDGTVWLHTGDIGRMDEDGFIFIDSRIKRLIIRHDGFKIFPTVIENVVGTHEEVDTCSAVRIKDSEHVQGDLPIVHVVLKEDHTKIEKEIEKELRAMCLENIPEYMQPACYKFREKLPYTGIGKIDYRALEEEYKETSELI